MSVVPQTILQFVDGSVHSAAAVELMAALPLPAGSEVVLVAAGSQALQPEHPLALAAQDQARTVLKQRGLRVTSRVMPGQAARQWRRVAEALDPNLVVIGAHGRRPAVGGPGRGIAHQVIEHARWPALIARAPFRGLRRVLLAVDGSPGSQAAVEFLAGFALPADAEVRVLHVAAPEPMAALTAPGWPTGARLIPPGPSLAGIAEWDRRQKAERAQQAQSIVTAPLQALSSAGVRARSWIACGDAADVILRYTRTHKIDLTVVGARGLGAVRGWLLGSVSRRLVQQARGSVLVVQ